MSIPDPIVLLDARARYVHPAFQMDRASTKTVFDATGRLVTVPANAIGWDHDPATGQSRGYLAELSATNLLLHSNDLTQGAWAKNSTSITPDAITGPDGNGMAKLVEDSSEAIHNVRQAVTIGEGGQAVFQFIAKAGERGALFAYIMNEESQSDRAFIAVDLSAGQITQQGGLNDASLIDCGVSSILGGFYYIWLTGTVGSTATQARCEIRLSDGSGTTYTGDGTSGLYLGYCQAEEGSYPTSYIETGASTVTRARDLLQCPSGTGLFLTNRGTFVIDATVDEYPIGNAALLSTGESNIVLRYSSTASGFIVTGDAIINSSIGRVEGRAIFSVVWDEANDDLRAFVNGVQRLQTNFIAGVSDYAVALGSGTGGSRTGFFRVHRAVYYPTRVSNADLQSLTAIQE